MRFNIAILFALAATTQVAISAPTPKWDDKDHEAVYKTGARVCGVAGYVCRQTGHENAGNALFGVAGAFGAAEVAVTASQGEKIPAAAEAVKDAAKTAGGKVVDAGKAAADAAKAAGGKVVDAGKFAGKCVGDACSWAAGKITGNHHEQPHDLEAQNHHRRDVESDDDNETTALLSRYAELEEEAKVKVHY